MKVIIGGTFAYLHKGHEALIRKAFSLGGNVYIGLTTDRYVSTIKRESGVPSYRTRRSRLVRFVKSLGSNFEIVPLNDRFGPSTTGDFDAIVVSDGTLDTAIEINRARIGNGLHPLEIINIGYVLAADSLPISSTRISKGEIDAKGRPKTRQKAKR